MKVILMRNGVKLRFVSSIKSKRVCRRVAKMGNFGEDDEHFLEMGNGRLFGGGICNSLNSCEC